MQCSAVCLHLDTCSAVSSEARVLLQSTMSPTAIAMSVPLRTKRNRKTEREEREREREREREMEIREREGQGRVKRLSRKIFSPQDK